MKNKINIDILGGISILVIAAFFFFQLGEDFSMFALFFPEKMLPILAILGLVILVKGFVRPTKINRPIFQINKNMVAAMLVGILWVLLLEPVGFVVTSFASVFGLQILYMPKEIRSPKNVFINAAGSICTVVLFYYVFVQYLGVTLPAGVLRF
ncbi:MULTISPECIES: tripartite tricarboxylate transporter TctB family protein [Desulfovibrio]|uniref:Tripartite tricarboxylate transporter TctB family protein n=1 Tax=Desulfovibrio desulfuricans TaxID=876 RepID=A0AA94HUX5_DESDE|nr:MULTISPECIES: tripartite tricarboxylate transporter TctB family protein [Desulfovibrio]ATD82517.1 tripartite tricarboxylate transporter TctB family protein [Desulfovibrio sp. G11]SFW70222.1 Tripartite tricarboxylate transporter TctB family protein [Desulfovibrio desulfuricans]SPD35315.1 Protein of unknown function (DUF1468) [Desulfovibrio sp. G11]